MQPYWYHSGSERVSLSVVTQGHGGTLTVESAEGEGATFVITLPA